MPLLLLVACGGASAATAPPTSLPPLEVEIGPLSIDASDLDGDGLGGDGLDDREARLLASEVVQSRRAREHGQLPPLERRGEAAEDAWPTVTIRNATDHGLVVWFAGPCARTSALAPRAETIVELCEGTYDLAAELAAPDFVPFVGNGDVVENGFAYEIVFYVLRAPEETRRARRRR
jgi:hypothetical protein